MIPDYILYAGYAGLFGAIVGWALARARAPRSEPVREPERGEPRSEEKEQERREVSLDRVLGLDRLLASKAYVAIRDALDEGKIRVELASDLCPGRVFLDIARQEWMCSYKGRIWRLGEEPAGVMVEEDEGYDPGKIFGGGESGG